MSEPIKELEIYFIRHAQSTGNAAPDAENVPFDEHHDPWLSEKGLAQADLLGKAFRDVKFDAFYSSAMRRTVSTSKGLVSYMNEKPVINLMPILSERGIPDTYPGQSIDELKKIYPLLKVAEGFDENGTLITQDKGVPDSVTLGRAKAVLDYLRERYWKGEKIAVVSHAAFLTYVIFYIFGIREVMPDFDTDIYNTGVTKITFYKKGTNPYGDAVFSYINDTRHLNVVFD